jgi:hypothetical protein
MENPRLGSSFEELLKEDGSYEEVTEVAKEQVMAWLSEQESSRSTPGPDERESTARHFAARRKRSRSFARD